MNVSRQALLLRGINIGPRNRIAMPALRDVLAKAGFGDPRTYLQSGNVVVSSQKTLEQTARECRELIKRSFKLDIDVIARSQAELAAVVERNPLRKVAKDPQRHLVTFLSAELEAQVISRLKAAAAPNEQLAVRGLEAYTWTPDGVARSKLWMLLASKSLGVSATSRNWTTVEALVAMAGE